MEQNKVEPVYDLGLILFKDMVSNLLYEFYLFYGPEVPRITNFLNTNEIPKKAFALHPPLVKLQTCNIITIVNYSLCGGIRRKNKLTQPVITCSKLTIETLE